eukprot:gene8128-776_t
MILFVAGSVGLLVAVVLLVIELRLRQQQQQQLREEGIETESNRNANNEIINNPDEQVENIGAGEEENEEDRHRDEQAQQHQQELHARRRRHHINQNIQDRPLYTRSIQRQQDSQTETLEQQHSFDDDTCPICLVQPPTHPCLTNCNHVYCAACFIQLSQDLGPQRTSCPMCRQPVRFLMLIEGINYTSDQLQFFSQWNRQTGLPTIRQVLSDTPAVLRMLFVHITSPFALRFLFQTRSILLVAIASFYFISPFDVIPEAVVGGIGILDDIVFVLGVVVILASQFRHVLLQNQAQWQ